MVSRFRWRERWRSNEGWGMKSRPLAPGTQRTRFAWWPVPIRRMGDHYLDPVPVRHVWLRPVTERLSFAHEWIAVERRQGQAAPVLRLESRVVVRALVVFHDHGTHVLARFMKPGFKHCFVAIETDGHWITLDGRAGLTVVEVACESSRDLAAFYRGEGFTVVETEQGQCVPVTPFIPYNCVGLVRAILAIDTPWVITPWQLFKHMTRRAERPTEETAKC